MPTKIEWTHRPGTIGESWNPVTGCTKVSEGCLKCYAERMARRLAGRCGYPERPNHFDVTLHPERLEEPLRWRKPRTVFVVSMGDLFHENVDVTYIRQVFWRMHECPQHTFQVLTKRPQKMFDVLTGPLMNLDLILPLPNVWLGVTAENQRRADERIPLLLQTPAAVRFVSIEPCLQGIILRKSWLHSYDVDRPGKIDWAIVGGESGPGARPMHPDWARSIRDQCREANVPILIKQMGTIWAKETFAWWNGMTIYQGGDTKGAIAENWPDDLRIREWPNEVKDDNP